MKKENFQLYQYDIAQEVRETYIDLLKRNQESTAITKELLVRYSDVFFDIEDSTLFWLALAHSQWEVGRLEDGVKSQAINQIDTILRIQKDSKENDFLSSRFLRQIREIILSQQPPIKEIGPYNFYSNDWSIGDVFAYPTELSDGADSSLIRYFIFVKVGETIWSPGHKIPVVRVKLLNSDELPKNEEELNALPYLQTAITDPRVFILSPQKYNSIFKNNTPDEYGLFTHYKLNIITTSSKDISSKLIYLGNFPTITPPVHEYKPFSELEVASTTWKDIEGFLLERFKKYYLRESAVYKKQL